MMKKSPRASRPRHERRGAVLPLAAFCLLLCLGFVAFAVDLGMVTLTKTEMQAAVDSAALAAAQEITNAVYQAGEDGSDPAAMMAAALAASRQVAADVAAENDTFVDPDLDVVFGQRTVAEDGTYSISWDATPPNVVRVHARRTNNDTSASDGKLKLLFARVLGIESQSVTAKATAFVEARDIVVALDYSSSMNDDSSFSAMSSSRLGKPAVESNLDDIWNALVNSNVTYSDSGNLKFPASGYGLVNSAEGTYLSSSNDETIYNSLNLNGVPWPQEGKTSSGNLNGTPSSSTSKSRWKDYISWVRQDSKVNSYGYRKKYGFRTLAAYLGEERYKNTESEDLWRAPYYQFHAMKEGVTLFTNFLSNLEFGDYMGLVVYWSGSKKEHILNDQDTPSVDLGDNWITDDYAAIDTIQRHKQAAHYGSGTGMGYGIRDARELLNDHKRDGTRPTILLMTDGYTNQYPSDFNLNSYWPGWDWKDVTDFNGDGSADYSTSDKARQYSFYEARKCIEAGYLIHTMAVGSSSDTDLMRAIARASGGVFYDVPSGQTIAELQEDLEAVFARIAANVPPAKLLADE